MTSEGASPLSFGLSVPVKGGVEELPAALASIAEQAVPVSMALLDASGDARVAGMMMASGITAAYHYHRISDDGQAAAIQEGWSNIGGDILGWLNTDDRLMPEALAKVATIFAHHPEIDVVYGQACYLAPSGAFIGYFPAYSADTAVLSRSNAICQPAAFVRRAFIERIGGLNPALHYTMDWDLWLRLRAAGAQFLALPDVLAAVVNRPDTKTNSGAAMRQAEIEATLHRWSTGTETLKCRLTEWVGRRHGEAALAGRRVVWRLINDGYDLLRWFGVGGRQPLAGYRYGLEPMSNIVHRRCHVFAPLPAGGGVALRLYCDNSGPIRLYATGSNSEGVAMQYQGRGVFHDGFGGPQNSHVHVCAGIDVAQLALQGIAVEGPGRWRLIALEAI
jgi:hypothetical protein